MNNLWKDLRYGKRMLFKNSGFTIIAVATLALGIGANTAIFSVVNAVLLRPLPYHNANELMDIYSANKNDAEYQGPISPVTYLNLKKNNSVFTEMAAISNKGWAVNLTGTGEPERLQGNQVSANIFQFYGVAPARGRVFNEAEDQPGNNRVVMLSYEAWQRRFGGNADLVGGSINLNGAAYTVIGVMPEDFSFAAKTDVWTTLAFTTADEKDEGGYLLVGGRLKPGISKEQARAEVDRLYRHQIDNPNSDARVGLKPLQESMTQSVERKLWILFAAVGFVLLIACANVANLLLARGSVRRREFAIRAAMGAGRSRLVRQLLVESAILALVGAAGGLLLADWGISFLVGGIPEYLKLGNSNVALLSIDRWALGFTFAMAFLTTIIFGLLPALSSSKVNLNDNLKEGGLSDAKGGGQNRIRWLLVVSEIALAMILLLGAGLMLKSFWRLSNVDPGFSSTGVLTANIDPTYKDFEQVVAFYRQLLERVRTIPGIEHAGIINSLGSAWDFTIEEHPPVPPEKRPSASNNQVDGDYFRAVGIPLRAGRFFDDRDIRSATLVAIIDETLAHNYFPNENPIGKHLQYQGASREIVGVVGASKFYSLDEKNFPHIYMPYQQENWWQMALMVRARAGDPTDLIPSIRRELAAIDKDLPIHSFKLLEEIVADWSAVQRFTASLMTGLAALAAILAAIGIYSVLAYSVTQRRHEIGIRMALGAERVDIFKLIIGEGMRVVAVGFLLGMVGAMALTRWLESQLFEVRAYDPLTYILIAVLLAGVALVACYIPARRATKTDPIVALRWE